MNCGKVVARKRLRFGLISRFFGTIAALVGDDEFYIASPAQRAVALEAADGRQVVRFLAESVFVETCHRRIDDLRRIEAIKRRSTGLRDPRRLIFEESLIGSDFAGLRGQVLASKSLQGLPTQPAEFVVVPHVHEGPTGASVLKIGIVQICAIDGAIIVDRRRDVKVADLFAVRIAD